MEKSLKRTPRNYRGASSPHKELKRILPQVLQGIEKKAFSNDQLIIDSWPLIIGEKLSRLTQAISFEQGVLQVVVKSHTLYSLLVQHERVKLIKLYQEKFPQSLVKNIYFKMG